MRRCFCDESRSCPFQSAHKNRDLQPCCFLLDWLIRIMFLLDMIYLFNLCMYIYIYMCIIFACIYILQVYTCTWRLMKGFRASIQSCKSSNSLPESPCILLSVLRLSIASFTPDLGYLSITLIQLHTVLVVTSTANMLGSIGIAGGVVVGNPYRKICQTLPLRRSRIKNVFVVWAEARGTVFGGISTKHGRPN